MISVANRAHALGITRPFGVTSLMEQFMPTNQRIVRAFIDNDVYKFTMGQLIHKLFSGIVVKWQLIVRTKKANLPRYILEQRLRQELDYARTLHLTDEERAYLETQTLSTGAQTYSAEFLDFLQQIKLPDYELSYVGENILLTFEGPWELSTWWEIYALEIVNELYMRGKLEQMTEAEREHVFQDAIARHEAKLTLLKQHPEVQFVDFGTRRRLSGAWQYYIDESCSRELGPQQFLGTSNMYNAWKLGLKPAGTNAHELPMVLSGKVIADFGAVLKPLHVAQRMVLDTWFEMYGEDLAVALPDTWTSKLFFEVFTPEDARKWRSLRQDSGDPINEGERYIREWEKRDVDPTTKTVTFSDGLEIPDCIRIVAHFVDRVKCLFGIGTSLTNDTLLGALSIVVKVVEAAGVPTVKLSENPSKALGPPQWVAWVMQQVGYASAEHQSVECKY